MYCEFAGRQFFYLKRNTHVFVCVAAMSCPCGLNSCIGIINVFSTILNLLVPVKKHSPSSSIKLDKNWVKSRLYLCWPKANMSQYVWMPFVSWCYTCNNLKKNSLGLCHFLGIQKGSIAHSFWQYGAVCKHCVKQSWTDPNSKTSNQTDCETNVINSLW